jgi:YidC/Oxa1 family membrane protein insertase
VGEQRNLFLAVAIAIAILLLYQMLVLDPAGRRAQDARSAEQTTAEQTVDGQPVAPVETPAAPLTRDAALALDARIPVRTPEISGSIDLTGARFDDVALTRYTRELDPASGVVTLLSPVRGPEAFYAHLGWTAADAALEGLPGPSTPWRLETGETLTPQSPVTLAYDSPNGLQFLRTISVDEHYMFTVVDRVTNRTGAAVELRPYGAVERRGVPSDLVNYMILHEGMVGIFDNALIMRKYKRLQNDRSFERRSVGGWLGITDKYWLAAVIPHPDASVDGQFEVRQSGGAPLFQASWSRDAEPIADGEVVEVTSYVFAGAKRAEILREYEETLGIHRLNDAIDWGSWFWFLTKPFFFVLEWFYQLVGNFGVAILALVVVLKAITFPLANMAFKSMARMKQLQPKMQELRERFKADAQRQQKEIMALYQREKVNPLAGCLPIFIQIPVFYALYKTLFVTIEMRHAPFFGWIQDLSARDPTNIWNLFGLLPYDPGAIPLVGGLIGVHAGTGFTLALGVLPLLYGITMAAMQTLNPPPPDPVQQKIFAFMPWVFMFILAGFASGLLIYWIWNNILSFTQQYVIMRRQGVDTPIGSFLSKRWLDLRARLAARGGGTGGGAAGGGATGGSAPEGGD